MEPMAAEIFAKVTKNGRVIAVDDVPIWITPQEEQAGMVVLEVKEQVKVGDYLKYEKPRVTRGYPLGHRIKALRRWEA